MLAPQVSRGIVGCSTSCLSFSRYYNVDLSHEKPAPEQLEHIQKRLEYTVSLYLSLSIYLPPSCLTSINRFHNSSNNVQTTLSITKISYVTIRYSDCRKSNKFFHFHLFHSNIYRGIDQLMQHIGTIGSLGQFVFPHIEMEACC